MKKSILIIGAGPGLSAEIARKFGLEGYQIGLISRNSSKLNEIIEKLEAEGIPAFAASADAANIKDLKAAIKLIREHLKSIDILVYNAAVLKQQDILTENGESLLADLSVNVSGALESVKFLHRDLKDNEGAVIFTGGGLANTPDAAYGSLSIGKAGLRNLAFQLHNRLAEDHIYVGIITINGGISTSSTNYSPTALAGLFWDMANKRGLIETVR